MHSASLPWTTFKAAYTWLIEPDDTLPIWMTRICPVTEYCLGFGFWPDWSWCRAGAPAATVWLGGGLRAPSATIAAAATASTIALLAAMIRNEPRGARRDPFRSMASNS